MAVTDDRKIVNCDDCGWVGREGDVHYCPDAGVWPSAPDDPVDVVESLMTIIAEIQGLQTAVADLREIVERLTKPMVMPQPWPTGVDRGGPMAMTATRRVKVWGGSGSTCDNCGLPWDGHEPCALPDGGYLTHTGIVTRGGPTVNDYSLLRSVQLGQAARRGTVQVDPSVTEYATMLLTPSVRGYATRLAPMMGCERCRTVHWAGDNHVCSAERVLHAEESDDPEGVCQNGCDPLGRPENIWDGGGGVTEFAKVKLIGRPSICELCGGEPSYLRVKNDLYLCEDCAKGLP